MGVLHYNLNYWIFREKIKCVFYGAVKIPFSKGLSNALILFTMPILITAESPAQLSNKQSELLSLSLVLGRKL
jgi:hypothetical protein